MDGAAVVLTLASAVTADNVSTLDLLYNLGAEDERIQDFAGNDGPAISFSQNKPPGVRLTYGAAPSGPRTPTGGGGTVQPPGGAPVAAAGDFEVDPGAAVTLDGSGSSGSSDPDGDALTWAWSQMSGESVTLAGANAAQATFTAPAEPGALAFRLTVADPGGLADNDEVTVRDLAPTFGDSTVAALVLAAGEAMDPMVLPEATGGNPRGCATRGSCARAGSASTRGSDRGWPALR